jgi:hypothetical protein
MTAWLFGVTGENESNEKQYVTYRGENAKLAAGG